MPFLPRPVISDQGVAIHSWPVVNSRGIEWQSGSAFLVVVMMEMGSIRDTLIATDGLSAVARPKTQIDHT